MTSIESKKSLLLEGFRWYGPHDTVPLSFIRQTGASEIFSALHHIPYGEVWSREEIQKRNDQIRAAGLRWSVVESVPVHESIKSGNGNLAELLENYSQTLRNLAAEGIRCVVYNFMPVLDWVRTEMRHRLPDGSECLLYHPDHFAAFDMFALERPGAVEQYSSEQKERASQWWGKQDPETRKAFIQDIIDVFPGVKLGLGLEDIRQMLARYQQVSPAELRANLARFLHAVLPVAEEVGIRLAIHPDDPPFPLLGLPRIVSTKEDLQAILDISASPANGLCFCTGSLSARPDNDLPAMVEQFAPRIHAVHLRSTQRLEDGSFYEANHLEGSVNMPAVVRSLLREQDRRLAEKRPDWQLCLRPDHGHTMMHELEYAEKIFPGYSCIGRMRGLAELRGVMVGLRYSENQTA